MLHPEPTSIENAYNFLRSVLLRRMELAMLKPEVQACVRDAMDQRNDRGIRTPRDLLRAVRALDAGRVIDRRSGEPVGWTPGLLVLPVSRALKSRFQDVSGRKMALEASPDFDFVVLDESG